MLKVKLATLCLEARLGATGEFSRDEWLGRRMGREPAGDGC